MAAAGRGGGPLTHLRAVPCRSRAGLPASTARQLRLHVYIRSGTGNAPSRKVGVCKVFATSCYCSNYRYYYIFSISKKFLLCYFRQSYFLFQILRNENNCTYIFYEGSTFTRTILFIARLQQKDVPDRVLLRATIDRKENKTPKMVYNMLKTNKLEYIFLNNQII